jgi:hypothetical protein
MVACGLESHKLIPSSSNTSFADLDSFIFCFLFVVIVLVSVVFFFTQQQDSIGN